MIEKDVWVKAPKEATHYSEETVDLLPAYYRVEEGEAVSMWLKVEDGETFNGEYKLDQGYQRIDYNSSYRPDLDYLNLIERVWAKSEWTPSIGDRVMYRNKDSIDYAWDKPEEMEVISVHGEMYGLLGGCGYVWSQLHNISPPSMKKTEYEVFEEDMLDILLDGWQTSPSRAKALCEVLYERGLRFTNTEKSV